MATLGADSVSGLELPVQAGTMMPGVEPYKAVETLQSSTSPKLASLSAEAPTLGEV